MRKLRMDRYTPQAAKEVRDWVEGILGERLASGDLMEALKDGVALCKYIPYISRMEANSNECADLRTWLFPPRGSNTSHHPCLLYRWRTYRTFFEHVNLRR